MRVYNEEDQRYIPRRDVVSFADADVRAWRVRVRDGAPVKIVGDGAVAVRIDRRGGTDYSPLSVKTTRDFLPPWIWVLGRVCGGSGRWVRRLLSGPSPCRHFRCAIPANGGSGVHSAGRVRRCENHAWRSSAAHC